MPEGMSDHRYVGWDSFVNLRRREAVFIDKVKELFFDNKTTPTKTDLTLFSVLFCS